MKGALHGRHPVAPGAFAVDAARHVRRQEHKALGRRHEAEGLARWQREHRRHVGQRHQHEHQTAQGVELPAAVRGVEEWRGHRENQNNPR